MTIDVDQERQARYERAVERAEQVREAWEADGRPLTWQQNNGIVGEHPLLKLLRESEHDCERYAREVGKRKPGRPTVGVVRATVGESPVAKLRRAK